MDITCTGSLAFSFSLQADNVRTWGDPVRLHGADIRPVHLSGTDIRPVNLHGADIRPVRLRGER